MAPNQPSIAVDFDGVIHSYISPWAGEEAIPDPPVPGAIEWLNQISADFRVIIFTTRGQTTKGRIAVRRWLVEHGMEKANDQIWTSPQVAEHYIKITATKPPALIYLDDRAVRFNGRDFPTASEIRHELTPWNRT